MCSNRACIAYNSAPPPPAARIQPQQTRTGVSAALLAPALAAMALAPNIHRPRDCGAVTVYTVRMAQGTPAASGAPPGAAPRASGALSAPEAAIDHAYFQGHKTHFVSHHVLQPPLESLNLPQKALQAPVPPLSQSTDPHPNQFLC